MDRTPQRRCRIIAEACANHLGDPKLQEEMIWAAAEAGADYIKFQSWQVRTNTRGQADAMAPYELSDDDHHRLLAVACKAKIGFSTTVFDLSRVRFVASLGLDFVKLASPDCGSWSLLQEVARSARKVVLSTGMSDGSEVKQAAALVQGYGTPLALLHCMYPLVDGHYHLSRMQWLRQFAPEVGLSDHSRGDDLRASRLAIALGADWVERHFIMSRSLSAKDAPVSVDPAGLRSLVEAANNPAQYLDLAERHPELLGDANAGLSAKVAELRQFYVGRWGNNA
jgi:N,N'-diacetyllegionaminate synthase